MPMIGRTNPERVAVGEQLIRFLSRRGRTSGNRDPLESATHNKRRNGSRSSNHWYNAAICPKTANSSLTQQGADQ
jgi:hypothetical protein